GRLLACAPLPAGHTPPSCRGRRIPSRFGQPACPRGTPPAVGRTLASADPPKLPPAAWLRFVLPRPRASTAGVLQVQSVSPRGAGVALLFGVALVGGSLTPALARPLLADQPWVTAYRETALYSSPGGSAVLGLVARGTSYRLDPSIPPQRDRLWAWSPYTQGYGWLPAP